MIKKRVFSLLIVTLLTLLLALTLTGCRKGESGENVDVTADVVVKEEKQVELLNETRWVTADAGLRMRDSAGSSGNKIGLIPNGEQVTLLLEEGAEETIAGASGRWSKVKWQEQEGWVFGGFLSAEQPVVVEDSVDVGESSGKTILIDGKEFDESVLYGLYLIDFRGQFYRIIEILPNNVQKSYFLIDDYDSKINWEFYNGLPDEYISMLREQTEPTSILKEIGVANWKYEDNSSILNIIQFVPDPPRESYKFKVEIKVSVKEGDSLEFKFLQSDREELNYLDEWEYFILKIKRI